MNALSLFGGMECGLIALKELGIPVENYYSSEIDKPAIRQTKHNFPEVIHLGDVTKWREWNIDFSSIDLILAGSPCQGFSFAGKGLAFDDPRSKLFFEFIDILNHIRSLNPDVKFMLENVNMKKEHMKVINNYCGLFPVNINSALVSAQNRNRWYWSNIRTRKEGLFGEVYTDIPQPEDRGIFLKDILEEEVGEKYYVSDAVLARMSRKGYSTPAINPEKAGTLNTKNNSAQMSLDSGTTFISIEGKDPTQRASTGRSLDKKHNYQFIKVDTNGNVKRNQDKASCITGAGGHGAGNHSDMDLIVHSLGCDYRNDEGFRLKHGGKSGTLLARERNDESRGQMVAQFTRSAESSSVHSAIIRRLTPLECSRLQTIPSWYEWIVSDTQIYRMCGNGWTIEVIKHILQYLKPALCTTKLTRSQIPSRLGTTAVM